MGSFSILSHQHQHGTRPTKPKRKYILREIREIENNF